MGQRQGIRHYSIHEQFNRSNLSPNSPSESKEQAENNAHSSTELINNFLLGAAGFIIIKELQRPQKRTLIGGMGVLINGNMVLTAFPNICHKDDASRRYGQQELFFKPFSHFKETIIVDKTIVPSTVKENVQYPQYCLLSLVGQMHPCDFYKKTSEKLQSSEIFRFRKIFDLETNTVFYYEIEVISSPSFTKQRANYELLIDDCQLSPIFRIKEQFQFLGIEISSNKKKREAILLQKSSFNLNQKWYGILPLLIQEYNISPQKQKQKRAQRFLSPSINFTIHGHNFQDIIIKDTGLYFDLSTDDKVRKLCKDFNQKTKTALKLSDGFYNIEQSLELKQIIHSYKQKQNFQKLLKYMNFQKGYFGIDDQTKNFAKRFTNNEIEYPLEIIFEKEGIQIGRQKIMVSSKNRKTLYIVVHQWLKKYKKVQRIFNLYDQAGKNIPHSYLYRGVTSIQQEFQKIIIVFKVLQCWISAQSEIMYQQDQNGQLRTLKVSQIASKLKSKYALTFSEQENTLGFNKISAYSEVKYITQYCRLKCSYEDEIVNLTCSGEAMVFSQKSWKSIQSLSLGDQIQGVSTKQGKNILVEYKVISLIRTQNKIEDTFFILDVDKSHNFISNKLIIHNRNSFPIKVYRYINQEAHQQQVKIFPFNTIQQFFPNYLVYYASNLLDNRKTFGDYNIQSKSVIYVLDSKERYAKMKKDLKTSQKFAILTNRERINLNRLQSQELKVLSQDYYCLFQNKLQLIDHTFKQLINSQRQILLFEKQHISKQYFYQLLQQKRQLFNPNIFNTAIDSVRIMLQFKQKYCSYHHEKFPIFYYTASNIFLREINRYLRERKYDERNNQKLIQNLSYVYVFQHSLEPLPKLNNYTEVFRGQEDFDFKCLESEDTIVTFSSYLSTSTRLQTAIDFAQMAKNPIILVLNVISGKNIENWSRYPNERQILISPSCHFKFQRQFHIGKFKAYRFTQIALPKKQSKEHIFFWVDDHSSNIHSQLQEFPKNSEALLIPSSSMLRLISQHYFSLYSFIGKESTIISNLSRVEEGLQNKDAGIDLLQDIIKKGYSNPYIFYIINDLHLQYRLEIRLAEQINTIKIFKKKRPFLQFIYQICQ